MQNLTHDPEYDRALRSLAILYVRFERLLYVDYMRGITLLSTWLIPALEERKPCNTGATRLDSAWYECDSYVVQRLSQIWRLDYYGVRCLLAWAKCEVEKNDPSNPQTSFPF